MSTARRKALTLVLAALVAVVLLALALPDLRLEPGMPPPEVARGAFRLGGSGGAPGGAMSIPATAGIILAAGVAAVILLALLRAARGVRLRRLGPQLLRGGLVAAALGLAVFVVGLLGRPGPSGGAALPPPPAPEVHAPLGPPPSPLLWAVAAGLVLAAGVVAALALRGRPPPREPLLLELELTAERARAALAAGEDARQVIVACWARMATAVAAGWGVERPGPATAREFGERLGALGLPGAPVRELTGLFEAVRYGRRAATADEEARAVGCLEAIVEACRGRRREGER